MILEAVSYTCDKLRKVLIAMATKFAAKKANNILGDFYTPIAAIGERRKSPNVSGAAMVI